MIGNGMRNTSGVQVMPRTSILVGAGWVCSLCEARTRRAFKLHTIHSV